MAAKIRFAYEQLETAAAGVLDTRGRLGLGGVAVHYTTVRLTIRFKTRETDARVQRMGALAARPRRYTPARQCRRLRRVGTARHRVPSQNRRVGGVPLVVLSRFGA